LNIHKYIFGCEFSLVWRPFLEKKKRVLILASGGGHTSFSYALAGAEVVVTHFSSTALEAIAYKKPTVIVLNPEWKRTIGKADAEIFVKKVGAAFISEINLEGIIEAIEKAKNPEPLALTDGTKVLADMILNL
jgi:CDP-glycerol glycerophosphotransferase (TagB/SpsB family)